MKVEIDGDALDVKVFNNYGHILVRCHTCGVWNIRAESPEVAELRAENERLKAAIETIKRIREQYFLEGRKTSCPRRDALVRDHTFRRVIGILEGKESESTNV